MHLFINFTIVRTLLNGTNVNVVSEKHKNLQYNIKRQGEKNNAYIKTVSISAV